MSSLKFLFGIALLIPLLGATMPAEAAKKDATALRAHVSRRPTLRWPLWAPAPPFLPAKSRLPVTTPMRPAAKKRVSRHKLTRIRP